MKSLYRKRLSVALALALAVTGGSAYGGSANDPPSIKVRYSEAQLSQAGGARELYSRLQSAARQVCKVGESRQLSQQAEARRCTERALAEAVAAVGDYRLAEIYAGRGHARPASRIAAATR